MLHENTVEVNENEADGGSDLLSSHMAMLDVYTNPTSPILR